MRSGRSSRTPSVRKASAHAKRDRVVLERLGVRVTGLRLRRAHRVLPPRSRAAAPTRSRTWPWSTSASVAPPARTGSRRPTRRRSPPAQAAGAEAELVRRLDRADDGEARRRRGSSPIYESMEMPLVEVLADLERAGVKVDTAPSRDDEPGHGSAAREPHEGDPHAREGRVQHQLPAAAARGALRPAGAGRAGRRRPRRRPPPRRRTCSRSWPSCTSCRGRSWSTAAIQKLKSTYVDALPEMVNPETGRIHATFNQTVAATGRLSATDPNLQNIPIRTPEGRRIREAFVAEPGHLLLSADYSQIELRVLAHLSGDPTLIDTFRRGEDVHDRTSREIFGPLSAVPPAEQRRISKMVNYALLYGKTAFTLAKDIGVSRKEAETLHRGLLRPLPEGPRLHRRDDREGARDRPRADAPRAAATTPRSPREELPGAHGGRAAGHEHAGPGLGRRPHQAGHDRPAPGAPPRGRCALASSSRSTTSCCSRCRRRRRREARALVTEVMEGALKLDVPLVADARLGKSWAEVH